jgi:hypothetical protein
MSDAKILLYNESLKNFIEKVGLNREDKDDLLERLSQMDLGERIALFKTLTNIYLLDLEEKEAIKRVKKFWQK